MKPIIKPVDRLSPERVREIFGPQKLRGLLKPQKTTVHKDKLEKIKEMTLRGCTAVEISKTLKMPRSSVYRHMPDRV